MYKCQICAESVPPNTKQRKIILFTRTRERDGGEEIQQEMNVCERCEKKVQALKQKYIGAASNASQATT